MTAASRSLATAPWGALRERLALCYTTSWDTTSFYGFLPHDEDAEPHRQARQGETA